MNNTRNYAEFSVHFCGQPLMRCTNPFPESKETFPFNITHHLINALRSFWPLHSLGIRFSNTFVATAAPTGLFSNAIPKGILLRLRIRKRLRMGSRFRYQNSARWLAWGVPRDAIQRSLPQKSNRIFYHAALPDHHSYEFDTGAKIILFRKRNTLLRLLHSTLKNIMK